MNGPDGAEFWYNTTYHSASHTTPYDEVLYGPPHPHHIPYLPGSTIVESVDRSLQKREATITLLKEHLAQAINIMKQQTDKHRSERVFQVGD